MSLCENINFYLELLMSDYKSNIERTAEHAQKFDREKTIKYLIQDAHPFILDIGVNVGTSLEEFKALWPDSVVHSFEPQEECWAQLRHRVIKFLRVVLLLIRSQLEIWRPSRLHFIHMKSIVRSLALIRLT